MLVNIIGLGSVSNLLCFVSRTQAMHVTSRLQICLTSEMEGEHFVKRYNITVMLLLFVPVECQGTGIPVGFSVRLSSISLHVVPALSYQYHCLKID
jgi:hypothetical protein